MRPKNLTIAEVEYTAFKLAKEFMTWNEPIPNFGSRFPDKLESCLNQPFSRFAQKDLYRGLIGKASVQFYLMIKNHPFQNGNKRIAVMSLLLFLYKNGKWLNIDSDILYKFARATAGKDPKKYEGTIEEIQKIIKKYLIDFPKK